MLSLLSLLVDSYASYLGSWLIEISDSACPLRRHQADRLKECPKDEVGGVGLEQSS